MASAIASAENSAFSITGALSVQALDTSNQYASVSGIAAAGLLALGFDDAYATSSTTTEAMFNDLASVSAGSLALNANGNDTNAAYATAGGGGIIAGSAAAAITGSTATTKAMIDNDQSSPDTYNIATGNVAISATHTANFSGKVDSTQASVVGASGATLTHTVMSTVDAHVGDKINLTALNLSIDGQNLTHNFFIGEPGYGLYPGATASSNYDPDNAGWNVQSGSGGLINLPAGSTNVNVIQNTNASIGDSSSVHLLAPVSGVSTLMVEAYNEAIVHEKVKMDSGGAIALAEADAITNVVDNATVSFGAHSSSVVDVGDVEAGAWGNGDINSISAATTYGLAGAPSGKAYANYTANNTTSVGLDARVEATDGVEPADGSTPTNGTVTLAAGDSPSGVASSVMLNGSVNLYNNTAIPISVAPDGQANAADTATVSIAGDPDQVTGAINPADDTHYGINAAGNITISADQGAVSTIGHGVGTNIYLEALSKVASAISNLFGGGSVTFNVTGGSTSQTGQSALKIDEVVDTGIQRVKMLTVSYALQDTGPNAYSSGSCSVLTAACLAPPTDGEIAATISGPYPVGESILSRLGQLQSLLQQYGQDPIASGAYQSEITFLENELVGLGLGKWDTSTNPPTFIAGNFLNSPTQLQQDQQQLTLDSRNLTIVVSNFESQTGSVVPVGDPTFAAQVASDVNDGVSGIAADATSAMSTIASFHNYAFETGTTKGNANDPTFLVDQTDVGIQVTNAKTEVATIGNASANNTLSQKDIVNQVQAIESAASDMASHPGDTTVDQAKISGASGTITGDLNAINTNASTERSEVSLLYSAVSTISVGLHLFGQPRGHRRGQRGCRRAQCVCRPLRGRDNSDRRRPWFPRKPGQ